VSCAGQRGRVIFHPGSAQEGEHPVLHETWQVIETQNGGGEAGIPEWLKLYLDTEVRNNKFPEIEALDRYNGKYVFIGENRGDNINVLKQWVRVFSVTQDLPRLVAQRVERRLVTAASLYPDDEYGEYFVNMIRSISNGEFAGAVKDETFWIKRQLVIVENEDENEDEFPAEDIPFVTERFEIFVLVSINKDVLQGQIRSIMSDVRAAVTVTRDQASAINRVQNTFFERF